MFLRWTRDYQTNVTTGILLLIKTNFELAFKNYIGGFGYSLEQIDKLTLRGDPQKSKPLLEGLGWPMEMAVERQSMLHFFIFIL